METAEIERKIKQLQGPILVLGASGFVGANLMLALRRVRKDVYGTTTALPAWRLESLEPDAIRVTDLLVDSNLDALLDEIRPRTIFDCVAYGGYSFQKDPLLIHRTNFLLQARLMERLSKREISSYVHAGSSSEYGSNSAGPHENEPLLPNSHYSVSKIAAAGLISYYGKHCKLPCANLRLYSVFGPMEDSSRLIPAIIRQGLAGGYPPLVNPEISRDFIYVDDVNEAFIDTALNLREADYGESFNIGTGQKTTIAQMAKISRELFNLTTEPQFSMTNRSWDLTDWYANVDKARERLNWKPSTDFRLGMEKTIAWYRSLPDTNKYFQASKQYELDTKHSVTAVIACYKDDRAIPIMHQRLKATFTKLGIDYEMVFVNDCSPDQSEDVIRTLTRDDRRVVGISHSRNFGSQAAFISGMSIATKNACVLLDGDLQDPPELIEEFVTKWRAGFDVVYGRRIKREAPWFMQIAYKAFYRVFAAFSYINIPRDAGDFSLLDRRVVQAILCFPERDLFLRGVRAFVGFKQTGVDYLRPERMFGRSTNNLVKNIGWAKKGILSFSNVPLQMLSVAGSGLLLLSVILAVFQIVFRLLYPSSTPQGTTTTLLMILFFGGLNIFAIGLVGEYVAKIFEESKRRPLFVRRSIIRDGEIRPASDTMPRNQARE